VRVSATLHDLSRATARWQFGDGTAATGITVRHVYRRTGYYRIRVTATDAAGHVATTSRRIRVLP
jgi:PKD repeat protein